jgi:prolyl oligopeptidase
MFRIARGIAGQGSVRTLRTFEHYWEFSPYHQVRQGVSYPAVLLCGFDGDTRTGPEHPRKMCAALQWATAGPRPILLRYEAGVGHSTRAVSRELEEAVLRIMQ